MKERPILFSAPMVQAILDGRKTQTRRIVKPSIVPHLEWVGGSSDDDDEFDFLGLMYDSWRDENGKEMPAEWLAYCNEYPEEGVIPIGQGYGAVGDRLWVRESFGYKVRNVGGTPHKDWAYKADNPNEIAFYGCTGCAYPVRWKPSIHMPRAASRILLEITDIRIERLQDITDEDAKLEGAKFFADIPTRTMSGESLPVEKYRRWSMENPEATDQCLGGPKYAFVNYFCKINGKAPKKTIDLSPWEANPWVWVISFKVLEPIA